MSAVLVEPSLTDDERRARLYAGDIVSYPPVEGFRALCDHGWSMVCDAFGSIDPRTAQFELPVEQFVDIISPLKTKFTHDAKSKQLITALLDEVGCDVDATYFDLPRLRIVTHGGYLTAGVGYAYKSHRDTWYACPPSQINWWGPITEINERCGLAFHPRYFDRAVPNSSEAFDAYRWNADGRKNAAQFITSDSRPHPHVTDSVELDWQVIVGRPASFLMFSAQQLHATVPNDSGTTRYSVDFRTAHRGDVEAHRGAELVDSLSTGTTLRDFIRASDYERLPDDVVAGYETGDADGVLIFEPDAPS